MGLEALSRGGGRAVLVDRDAKSLAVAAANASSLGATGCTTVRLELPGGLTQRRWRDESFDLVFADPPYRFADWEVLLHALAPLLAAAGEIAIEHGADAELPAQACGLRRTRQRRYGSSRLSFYAFQGGA